VRNAENKEILDEKEEEAWGEKKHVLLTWGQRIQVRTHIRGAPVNNEKNPTKDSSTEGRRGGRRRIPASWGPRKLEDCMVRSCSELHELWGGCLRKDGEEKTKGKDD